jgi:hypothetical protein
MVFHCKYIRVVTIEPVNETISGHRISNGCRTIMYIGVVILRYSRLAIVFGKVIELVLDFRTDDLHAILGI